MDRFTAHMDRAWDCVSKGDTAKARIAALRALAIDRNSPEVHNLLGFIHAMDGDVDEALADYRRAMDLDEEYVDPMLNTAELLVHAVTDPEEAIRLCRNATEITHGREELVDAILLEVDALLSLSCLEEARKRLAEIDEPRSLPPAYGLLVGRGFYEAEDPASAKGFVERALVEEPENSNAWYYHGLIAQDEGLTQKAREAFLKVLALDAQASDPPWAKKLEPIEHIVEEAIAALDQKDRAWLEQAEVIICDSPSIDQVEREVDPRQIACAERLDTTETTILRLWIFSKNLMRLCLVPDSAVNDLTNAVEREIQLLRDSV